MLHHRDYRVIPTLQQPFFHGLYSKSSKPSTKRRREEEKKRSRETIVGTFQEH